MAQLYQPVGITPIKLRLPSLDMNRFARADAQHARAAIHDSDNRAPLAPRREANEKHA